MTKIMKSMLYSMCNFKTISEKIRHKGFFITESFVCLAKVPTVLGPYLFQAITTEIILIMVLLFPILVVSNKTQINSLNTALLESDIRTVLL